MLVIIGPQAEPESAELLLHFFQALPAEVANLHHVILILLHQLSHAVDAGAFQAVIGANGKIQFCFCAGSSVYLIDRLGRFVSGFPVDLGKTVLLGPSVLSLDVDLILIKSFTSVT